MPFWLVLCASTAVDATTHLQGFDRHARIRYTALPGGEKRKRLLVVWTF